MTKRGSLPLRIMPARMLPPRMFVSIFAHMRCVVAATVIGVGLSQTALAQQTPQPQPHRQQFAEDNWLTRILQPSAQPSVPAQAQGQAQSQAQPQAQTQSGAAREWSGQSGGSRHPLM